MIDQVRRFNRTVTQRIGALDDAFLARGRPLGQARLVWEIGPDGSDVRDLRSRLDLDSGYLSRLLRALENDGLITVEVNEADGRLRTVRLTVAGLAERAQLDRRSDDAAAALLSPLTARQRSRLVTAMAEVERLLAASAVQVSVRDPRQPDARHCLRAYVSELADRFHGGFVPARSISAADHEMTLPAGLFLVATLHAEPVGCGALKFHPGAPALPRGDAVQRRTLRPPLVREDPLTGCGCFPGATIGGWTKPCVITSTVSTPRTGPCSTGSTG